MQIVFSILFWVIVAFVALLLIVLFVPIGVAVKLDYDKPTVFLRVLFFKFRIYPLKSKDDSKESTKAKTAREKKEITKKDKRPKAHTSKNRKFTVDKILEIIKAGSKAIQIVFKGIFFTKIEIIYPVHKEDSAENAIAYGETQAYFGGVAATLQNFFHLSFKRVQIIPDFTDEHKYKRYFYCNIWSTTFIMVVAAVYMLIALRRENII